MFRYVVLGLLHGGAPRHGYALMKDYRDRTGVQIGTGNFYRDLQQLVASGLIRITERAPEGDPRRTPYQITDAGRQAFRAWFVDVKPLSLGTGHDDDLSARIPFLCEVDPEQAHMIIGRLQDDLWIQAKTLEHMRNVAISSGGASAEFPVLPLMLARRLRRVAAEVSFLEELRTAYDAWLARQTAAPASATKRTSPSRSEPKARAR